MNVSKHLPLAIALGLLPTFAAPSIAIASATYYCTTGNCSNSGGNGDNGTNNGNNSSNNTLSATGGSSTINLNINGTGSSPGGSNLSSNLSSGTASGSSSGSSGSGSRSVNVPIQLPSFSASGCGARPTVYGGLTGTPLGTGGSNNGSNLGFGLGFLTGIGREPDSCKPPVVTYTTNNYVTTPTGTALAPAETFAPVAAAPMVASPALASQSAQASCTPIDRDVAIFYAHDLRLAQHTNDTNRIDRDMRVLDKGCYHALVISAIVGH